MVVSAGSAVLLGARTAHGDSAWGAAGPPFVRRGCPPWLPVALAL